MMYTRYVIQLKNGDFMRQEFHETLERVKVFSVENPLNADKSTTFSMAKEALDNILSGNTNLLVLYDENNPPERVVEVKFSYEIIK